MKNWYFLIRYKLQSSVQSPRLSLSPLPTPSLHSAANWLKPPELDQKKRHAPRYLTRAYWHNNSRKLLFLCSYACLSLLLFIGAMLQHSQGGGWFMVAKGCGQCLNFNCTFVMVRPRDELVQRSSGLTEALKPRTCCPSTAASRLVMFLIGQMQQTPPLSWIHWDILVDLSSWYPPSCDCDC